MKTKFNTIKLDMYNVFIAGDATTQQIARIYYLFAIPGIMLLTMLGHWPRY